MSMRFPASPLTAVATGNRLLNTWIQFAGIRSFVGDRLHA